MKYIVVALFCAAIAVSGCTKSTSSSPKDILTSHNWYLERDIQDTVGIRDTIDRQVPVCASDDYITFDKNGGSVYNNGPINCDTTQPASYVMTYDLSGSKAINMYTFMGVQGNNYVWNIVTLSSTVLEVTYTDNNNPKIYYHRTYVAK